MSKLQKNIKLKNQIFLISNFFIVAPVIKKNVFIKSDLFLLFYYLKVFFTIKFSLLLIPIKQLRTCIEIFWTCRHLVGAPCRHLAKMHEEIYNTIYSWIILFLKGCTSGNPTVENEIVLFAIITSHRSITL